MPKQRRNVFPDFHGLGISLDSFIRRLPKVSGNEAENFFKDRFEQKGWIDNGGMEKWEPSKHDDGTGSLMLRSSHLKDSIVNKAKRGSVTVSSDTPYSEIHNEGGVVTIPITKRARKYFWYMYKATGKGMWKGMALTKKKAIQFNMPQRKFIGESQFLMNRLEKGFKIELEKYIKQKM